MHQRCRHLLQTTAFISGTLLYSCCHASDLPTVYGFSLQHSADDLLHHYQPTVVGNRAFIYKESLPPTFLGVEFSYTGSKLEQLTLILDEATACIDTIATLVSQFGKPSAEQQDGDTFAVIWHTANTSVIAYGICGNQPRSFRITLAPRKDALAN